MPNWCSNYISMLAQEADLDQALGRIINQENELDFEQIIVMPPLLKSTREGKQIINGAEVSVWIRQDNIDRALTLTEAEEIKHIGFASWYDWALVNWGTKWNAQNTDLETSQKDHGFVKITFDTAWTPPVPIAFQLKAMFPSIEFEFRYRLETDHLFPHSITHGGPAELEHKRFAKMVTSEQNQWL